MLVYSSFISGIQDIINTMVLEYGDVKRLLDGGIFYETKEPHNINRHPCFNNHFEVLSVKYADISPDKFVVDITKKIEKMSLGVNPGSKTFRVVASVENQFVSLNKGNKTQLEKRIEKRIHCTVDRAAADEEFWVLKRSENIIFFMRRLNYHQHRTYTKVLRKGQLKPELVYIMNYLSEPNHKDNYLDPFAGSGALSMGLIENFIKVQHIYAFDIDKESVVEMKRLQPLNVTFCNIACIGIDDIEEKLQANSISKIVTDPPWGFYEKIDNIELFYNKMLERFKAVSSVCGKVVLLAARTEAFEKALSDSDIQTEQVYHILVSGKKANIYVFHLNNNGEK